MATSKDFKALFDRFQEEGAPHGVSIFKYCQMNGVVYSQFERWYKKHASALAPSVMPVELVNSDSLSGDMKDEVVPPVTQTSFKDGSACIAHLNIVFSNGLQVNHHRISYQTLRLLVEKLEALC